MRDMHINWSFHSRQMRAHNDRMNVFGNTNTKLDNDSVEENIFSVDWLHHGYYPINLKILAWIMIPIRFLSASLA